MVSKLHSKYYLFFENFNNSALKVDAIMNSSTSKFLQIHHSDQNLYIQQRLLTGERRKNILESKFHYLEMTERQIQLSEPGLLMVNKK